jgi:hypothetical protein
MRIEAQEVQAIGAHIDAQAGTWSHRRSLKIFNPGVDNRVPACHHSTYQLNNYLVG